MKKLVLIVMMMVPVFVSAQKPVKPNLNKALSLWQEGKLGEAKEMIDLCTTYEKTMNEGKTWYYRGLIYASLDTTSNATYKALAPNALATAMEAFKKADAMATGGKEYFINDPNNLAAAIQNTKSVQLERLANAYLAKSIEAIQLDEPDYKESVYQAYKSKQVFENGMEKYMNDTLAYFILAIAAHNCNRPDTAMQAAKDFYAKGGKGKEPYLIVYQIYNDRDDKEKALEVIREAKAKLPNEPQFPLIELELLINMNKIDEAKAGLEKELAKDPGNKTLHFFLGYANTSLNKIPEARKNFEEALKIDPKYFEAQVYLARNVGLEAKQIKQQMNKLGISPADKKKKMELDGVYVQKLKLSLPYWEKAEKLNPSDEEVLIELYSIYQDLGMDAQVQRVDKRMKELGIE